MERLPQRTCMGCNTKQDKKDLIRIVKNKNNEIFIDTTGKMDGRGTYLCKKIDCIEKAIKNKRISKTLKMEIPQNLYENLKQFINGGEIIG